MFNIHARPAHTTSKTQGQKRNVTNICAKCKCTTPRCFQPTPSYNIKKQLLISKLKLKHHTYTSNSIYVTCRIQRAPTLHACNELRMLLHWKAMPYINPAFSKQTNESRNRTHVAIHKHGPAHAYTHNIINKRKHSMHNPSNGVGEARARLQFESVKKCVTCVKQFQHTNTRPVT